MFEYVIMYIYVNLRSWKKGLDFICSSFAAILIWDQRKASHGKNYCYISEGFFFKIIIVHLIVYFATEHGTDSCLGLYKFIANKAAIFSEFSVLEVRRSSTHLSSYRKFGIYINASDMSSWKSILMDKNSIKLTT